MSAGTIRKVAFGTPPPGFYASAPSLFLVGTVAHPIPPTQVLAISTLGAPISFKVSATTQSGGANWLSASTPTGTTTQTMSISIANGPTTAGTYKGTLTFTPTTQGYSPINVPVTFVINARPRPHLSLRHRQRSQLSTRLHAQFHLDHFRNQSILRHR